MENIDNFLTACCKLGVPAHALVDTADIFEMRDTPRVVECLVSELVGRAFPGTCTRASPRLLLSSHLSKRVVTGAVLASISLPPSLAVPSTPPSGRSVRLPQRNVHEYTTIATTTTTTIAMQHALGSAAQVSCPAFGGPHLGPAADPSLVTAISPVDGDNRPPEDGDDDDDDEDGAFGDFWRASTRCAVFSRTYVDVHMWERPLLCIRV